MGYRLFFITFAAIFLAELGDKTQLATMSLTAQNTHSRWIVFSGAALALVFTSFIGVMLGDVISRFFPAKYIRIAAAVLFIVIGIFMLISREKPTETKYGLLIRELQNYRAEQFAACRHCEKFQTILKKIEMENDMQLSQAIGPLKVHSEKWQKAKECPDCNAEKMENLHKMASKDEHNQFISV